MAHHFRPDNSCYHVVDYDPETGEVRKRQTAQGYADESAWAVMIARQITVQFVKGRSRTSSGRSITRFIRDVRSIIIPVRNEIFRQVLIRKDEVIYFLRLVEILLIFSVAVTSSISVQSPAPAYRAKVGTNGNFILMHSVGSIPHGQEIDVPLNYADYYFLEGLMRKRDLEKK